jgi:hypothetical protein
VQGGARAAFATPSWGPSRYKAVLMRKRIGRHSQKLLSLGRKTKEVKNDV